MLLRQVQAGALQGHHLRALRRRGDAPEGASRADGSYRPGRARLAHLVLQGRSEPDRLPARHRPARAREGAVLRRVDRHRRRRRGAGEGPRRPRGQGPHRFRADLRRSRRGARGAGAAASAAARLLREGQGQGLRRGRRLLGARPEQLGRGETLPPLEEARTLASEIFPELSEARSRPRIRRRSASSSARRRRGRTASSRRASSSRSRPPPSRSRRRSARSAASSRLRRARRRARSPST